MKLEKLSYSEFEAHPQEWTFDNCTFGEINLIVGKNATGKSRTLTVIRSIAGLISDSNELAIGEGKYTIELTHENKVYVYSLEHHNKQVFSEELKINDVTHLKRDKDGTGKITAIELGQDISFKTEINRLAVVAKRDSIQHPFIDDLYRWAQGVTKLDFGSNSGKGQLVIKADELINQNTETKLNIKETDKVISFFLHGEKEFGNRFKKEILSDMNLIDFSIEDIGVDSFDGVSIVSPQILSSLSIGQPSGIYVQETDLKIQTIQLSMSDGMFSALSAIVQFNYILLSNNSTCLLIDDIGEGLDFGRSSALVKRLIEKAQKSPIQLLMTTNDRFIMNAVPLEYWLILTRQGGQVTNLNYRNAKDMFDEFENTGLSNFDLFSSGYYKKI